VSSPAHQVQRCANATSPRLFHGTDGGPRPHDSDDEDDDEDEDEDDGDDVGVLSCRPCSIQYGGAASVLLERLTMPGTTRISFLPSRAAPPRYHRTATSLPLRSCLTPCHPLPSGGYYCVNGRVASDLPPPSPRPESSFWCQRPGVSTGFSPEYAPSTRAGSRGTGWEETGG